MIDEELQRITEATREISYSLHPSVLEDFGLITALKRYSEKYVEKGDMKVEFEAIGFDERLPQRIGLALYRIAQEALNNVVKHAHASQVEIALFCTPRPRGEEDGRARVELRVRDNGRGFDPSDVPTERLGLTIVGERAQAIGAELRLESGPGQGTMVEVVWVEKETIRTRDARQVVRTAEG